MPSKSNHQGLGSPVPPLSSRPNSFGPLSQYHLPTTTPQHHHNQPSSAPTTQIVSPLSARFPSSGSGYLSPVSIVSPELSFPPELLHHDDDHHQRALTAASEVPQTVHLARGGTVHLQEHVPFKQAALPARNRTSTRFPIRKQLAYPQEKGAATNPSSSFPSSDRPRTTYLADLQPHRLAAAPAAAPTTLPSITTTTVRPFPRPNYQQTTATTVKAKPSTQQSIGPTFHSMGFQDVELGDLSSTTTKTTTATGAQPAPTIVVTESEEDAEIRTYEVKRRRRNWIIGGVFFPMLVAIIVVFAVLVVRANKS